MRACTSTTICHSTYDRFDSSLHIDDVWTGRVLWLQWYTCHMHSYKLHCYRASRSEAAWHQGMFLFAFVLPAQVASMQRQLTSGEDKLKLKHRHSCTIKCIPSCNLLAKHSEWSFTCWQGLSRSKGEHLKVLGCNSGLTTYHHCSGLALHCKWQRATSHQRTAALPKVVEDLCLVEAWGDVYACPTTSTSHTQSKLKSTMTTTTTSTCRNPLFGILYCFDTIVVVKVSQKLLNWRVHLPGWFVLFLRCLQLCTHTW